MNLTARAASILLLLRTPFRRTPFRRDSFRRAPFRFALPVLTGAALVLAVAAGLGAPAPAGEPGLDIELNKVEDNGGSCLASFVFRNRLGHTLNRFSMDLYVFDRDGVIARRQMVGRISTTARAAPSRWATDDVCPAVEVEARPTSYGYV